MAQQLSKPVYLIDSSIYIFQSHFSPYIECLDKNGNDLSAVYGFSQFLLQFLRRVKPRHIALAHDESLFSGFRHSLCPNYKSNRELPDENLALQLRACSELGTLLGLASYSSKQYEADDIIGTLATSLREGETGSITVEVVSRDKDLAQLLRDDSDCLWDYSGNKRRHRDDVYAEYGIHPEQFPDYLGLVGDSVDCISGVPGVGPVKARELLRQFESMEGIYRNLDKVSALPLRGASRLGEVLLEHQELAQLSKVLATIVCDVSATTEDYVGVDLAAMRNTGPDREGLRDFLSSYKFNDGESRRLMMLADSLQAAPSP